MNTTGKKYGGRKKVEIGNGVRLKFVLYIQKIDFDFLTV